MVTSHSRKRYWLLTAHVNGQQVPFAFKTYPDFRARKGTLICNGKNVPVMLQIQQIEIAKDAIELSISQFAKVARNEIKVKQIHYKTFRQMLKNAEATQLIIHRKRKK
jgi:hypothetical protein